MKPTPPASNPALLRYAQRALGAPASENAVETLPRTDIVHLHAEVVRRTERLRKVAPEDGGRKS